MRGLLYFWDEFNDRRRRWWSAAKRKAPNESRVQKQRATDRERLSEAGRLAARVASLLLARSLSHVGPVNIANHWR